MVSLVVGCWQKQGGKRRMATAADDDGGRSGRSQGRIYTTAFKQFITVVWPRTHSMYSFQTVFKVSYPAWYGSGLRVVM